MSLELLSLGLDFAGGLMGMSSASKNRKAQERMNAQNLAAQQGQFDAQMDTSITRRVKDAKTAGIHPLFAMGANVGASPTLTGGTAASQGNPMGNALTRMANTLGVIEQNRASARRDEAQAQLFDSERARIDQDLASRGHDSPGFVGPPQADRVSTAPVELGPATFYSPEVPFSSAPGVRAGLSPKNTAGNRRRPQAQNQ